MRSDKLTPGRAVQMCKIWNKNNPVGTTVEVVGADGKRTQGLTTGKASVVKGKPTISVDHVEQLLARVVAIGLVVLMLSGCTFDEVYEAFHDPAWDCLGVHGKCIPEPEPTIEIDGPVAPGESNIAVMPSDEGL